MKKILGLLFISSSMFSMELDTIKSHRIQEVFIPDRLGSLELYYSDKGFSVYQDDKKHDIKKYHTDKMLRNINKKQLKGFLKGGYLALNQMDDGEFSLQAKGRVNGGGPILGLAAYVITKSICYGTLAAALAGSMAGLKVIVSPGTSGNSPYTPSINDRALGALTEVTSTGLQIGLATAGATATVPLATGGLASGGTVSLASLVSSGAVTGGFVTTSTSAPVVIGTVATGLGTGGASLVTQAALTGAGLTHEAALVSSAGIVATSGTTLGVTGTIELIALKVGMFFGMAPTL